MVIENRMTITDVAKDLGVTPRTIMRWEKSGKIKKCRRDWRGWRFYLPTDLQEIKTFYESAYDAEEYSRNGDGNSAELTKAVSKALSNILIILIPSLISAALLTGALTLAGMAAPALTTSAFAETNFTTTKGIRETSQSIEVDLQQLPAVNAPITKISETDDLKYTLGPDDRVAIEVRRHPEFSGEYTINSEGMIEYKFVGDIYITGLTKNELKDKITDILSEYVIEPDVDVMITAYLSKIFYVVGEVGRPGKFYMRGNTVTAREALFQAGLPTYAAAMRRSRMITPDATGKREKYKDIDVFKLLYEGDLTEDLEMQPGDVLYVPATAIAKVMRVISPVTNAARETASTAAVAGAL